jgi:hypothetical protein
MDPRSSATEPSIRRRRRWRPIAAGFVVVASLLAVAPGAEVGADAGNDLAISLYQGPAGTEVELLSPDTFSMGADVCPGAEATFNEGDTFEVRWEIGPLPGSASELPYPENGVPAITTLDSDLEVVLATGSVATEPGVPWSTTVTIPASAEPGQLLVINAECWRVEPGGVENVWMNYYYLPVFLVTNADGSLPTTTLLGSEPGAAPEALPAQAEQGSPAFTG